MEKSQETSRSERISRPKLGRLGMVGRRIKDLVAVTALGLMSVLGACEKGEISQKTAIERCYNPEHRQKYPFQQMIFVALAVHIVMNDDGTSNINEDGIRENINDLRRVYGDIIMDFYVARVRRVHDSTLQPYVIPGESHDEYKDRLRAYMDENGTDGAVDVMYIPGYTGGSGTYLTTPKGEEFLALYTNDDGTTYMKKATAHEMAHLFELKHPFASGGDGLDDTINYSQDCTSVITFMTGDVCMAACSDGSNAAPVNLMDYNVCIGNVGQTIQTPEELTYDQLEFANCVLQSAKTDYINPDLDEIDF